MHTFDRKLSLPGSTEVKTPEHEDVCARTSTEAPTHLFNKYLLINYHVPGLVLDTWNTVNKTHENL